MLELEIQWHQSGFDTSSLLDKPFESLILQAIEWLPQANKLPLLIEDLRQDIAGFESLFLRDNGLASKLKRLHDFEPLCKRKVLSPNESISAEHLEFPSSGDNISDQIASLLSAFSDSATAQWLYSSFSAERIDKIIYVLRELNRPLDERINEHLLKIVGEKNPSLFGVGSMMSSLKDLDKAMESGDFSDWN